MPSLRARYRSREASVPEFGHYRPKGDWNTLDPRLVLAVVLVLEDEEEHEDEYDWLRLRRVRSDTG
jgi:hypothetical protein